MCISFVTKQFPDLCLHVCFFFIFICQDCMLSSKSSFNRFLFPGQLILKRCSDVSILPNNLIAQTIMGISKTQKPTSAVCLSHGPYCNRGQDPVLFPWVILKTSPSALPQNMPYLRGADQGKVQRLSCPLSSMQGNSELISVLEVSMDSDELIMKNTPPCKSLCPVLSCPSMHAERC